MNQSAMIEKAIVALHQREQAYKEAVQDYAEAEFEYKRARAHAYLTAEGTIKDKDALADIKTEKEHQRKLACEATLALTKAMLEDCRAVLSARQSILSAMAKGAYTQDMYATRQT